MSFSTLKISDRLISKLDSANITSPTEIQRLVIPHIIEREDILIRSKTGSGKTLAYLLPLVERLHKGSTTLILLPTRELAQQIKTICSSLLEGSTMHCALIHGGVEYTQQYAALASQPEIIISTPGRLIDLISQHNVEIPELDALVLDEADQMVEMGFVDAITLLAAKRRANAQTISISATMPERLEFILHEIAPKLKRLELGGRVASTIEHRGYFVERTMMDHLLLHILKSDNPSQAIIFTRSRKMAERLTTLLIDNGIAAEAMHSDRSQTAREHIISRLRSAETRIVVATDLIARGIDIDSISHIYNYGLPQSPELYIHRIGRTARAGRTGIAVTLCIPEDKPLLDATCKLMHQHIAMSLNHPYITPNVSKTLSERGRAKKK
ncbi:MAG: DEAD/DEAH box helicase [Rikenellaceae bacterium]